MDCKITQQSVTNKDYIKLMQLFSFEQVMLLIAIRLAYSYEARDAAAEFLARDA